MARKMVLQSIAGATPVLSETPADNEAQLQELVRDFPDVIPIDEYGMEGPLMVVGRETALPAGAVDLVALARSGELLVIELKTGPQNSDFRHALAQLFDYGAGLWGQDLQSFEQAVAVRHFSSPECHDEHLRDKQSLESAATAFWTGLDGSELERIRERLRGQLERGEFSYVLIAQRFTSTMLQTLRYVNAQLRGARCYGVELVRFSGGGFSAFEARTVVSPPAQPVSAATTNQAELLDKVSDGAYRDFLERLLEACRGLGLTFEWGTAGVSIRVATPDRAEPLTVAWLYPPGKIGFSGLTGLTLGADRSSLAKTPTVASAIDWYVGRAREIPGANPTTKGQLKAVTFRPVASVSAGQSIINLIGDLTSRIGALKSDQ